MRESGRRAMKITRRGLAPIYRSPYFPPAIIFVVIFGATIFSWLAAKDTLHRDITVAANASADNAIQALRERMLTYEQVLHGGTGLFRSSDVVTHDEWESFLTTFNADTDLSGVQNIGFDRVFSNDELPDVQDFMAGQGVQDFTVTPVDPPRSQYASLLYVHPVGSQKVPPYGYDMYTQPLLRTTMEQARDIGNVAMTPRIELLPIDPNDRHFGFGMFSPYYLRSMPTGNTSERQAALRGYVFAMFDANTFFSHTIGNADNQNMGFYVAAHTDGTTRTMYESPMYKEVSKRPHAIITTRKIPLYGQVWTLRFAYDSKALVSTEQFNRPDGLLFFGTLSAFLVAVVISLLLKTRARDIKTQREKAVELAKDELLSLASHQLRTPATGVKQYVGMVLQGFAGKVPQTQRKLLEKAYSSNDRQLRIINEILHLAKIDAGRIVLAKQPTNLNDLVTDIVNEQRPDIAASKHTIQIDLPRRPLVVNVDMHMLRMAIENLLSNAIKYTPAGGQITVHVYKHNQQAKVSVTDTGVGIAPADMNKVFQQFSRLDNPMSQQVGGTGIGLYLAKHLVELHGGTIKVTSTPGKGSTFAISLPT